MKSQIVPVLLFCLVFPWIVARVFQLDGYAKAAHKSPDTGCRQETGAECDHWAVIQTDSSDELSNKQINYLIP